MYNAEATLTSCSLESIYGRADVWRGRLARPVAEAQKTGFTNLDQALHNGGWPSSGLVELLCENACPHAMRLLLPTLKDRQDGLIAMANPPARPQARMLNDAGVHSGNLLVMRSQDSTTLLRACRESAASGAVSALLAWLPDGTDTPENLRRLHVAAKQGRCLLVVFRHARHAINASPAPLRLVLQSTTEQLHIEVIKQPSGWAGQKLALTLQPGRIASPMSAPLNMPAPSACSEAQSLNTTLWPSRSGATEKHFGSEYPKRQKVIRQPRVMNSSTDHDSRFSYRPRKNVTGHPSTPALTQNLSLPL